MVAIIGKIINNLPMTPIVASIINNPGSSKSDANHGLIKKLCTELRSLSCSICDAIEAFSVILAGKDTSLLIISSLIVALIRKLRKITILLRNISIIKPENETIERPKPTE